MYYEIYIGANYEYHWRFNAPNHKTIAKSGEGYKNKSECENAIDLIKNSGVAPIRDNSRYILCD